MIAYIKGSLTEEDTESIVVEAGGIGYQIYLPLSSIEKLPAIGSDIKVHTFFQVREDGMQLYGFLRREELECFKMLIKVSGIGPKGALSILSGMTGDELRLAILSQDAKLIAKRSAGIGLKTAQKLILELKDKIHPEDAFSAAEEEDLFTASSPGSVRKEAILAMTALGISNAQALKAVSSVENAETMTVEALLKAALKRI